MDKHPLRMNASSCFVLFTRSKLLNVYHARLEYGDDAMVCPLICIPSYPPVIVC